MLFGKADCIKLLLSHAFVAIISFQAGCSKGITTECPPACHDLLFRPRTPSRIQLQQQHNINASSSLLPPTVQHMFVGMGRVDRDAFARSFDVGIPYTPYSTTSYDEVLLFYSDESSLPDYDSSLFLSNSGNIIPIIRSPEEAAKNCMTMKMILIDARGEKQSCLALVAHDEVESSVVSKWMRVSDAKKASLDQPLKIVSRTRQRDNSYVDYIMKPTKRLEKYGFDFYSNYMNNLEATLTKLRPIAQGCVKGKKDNTIIVMVCNHGQSELFLNFVCSARARGLDTSQVLLFATDMTTKELAEGMGIATFYDEKIFGQLPNAAAKKFNDETFMKMTLAKVYCQHMISQLKYNVLFQDVDIIWKKNPLDFFSLPNIRNFDMYFQDNGSRVSEEQPYHANTGFFWMQYTKRTAYFFSILIRQPDVILKTNEQVAMNMLIHDHVSTTGLRVKTFSRHDTNFIGGWQFHADPGVMKAVMQGNVTPFILHMSWARNKIVKRHYLEQMGFFFVSNHCVGKTTMEIQKNSQQRHTLDVHQQRHALATSCCLAEPIAKCHYRDKPSKIPCRDSPPMEAGAPSFW